MPRTPPNPKAKASEIVKLLGEKGVKVTAGLVYAVNAVGKAKANKLKRTAAKGVAVASGMSNPAEAIMSVRAFAVKFGGMKKLKQIVDLLAE